MNSSDSRTRRKPMWSLYFSLPKSWGDALDRNENLTSHSSRFDFDEEVLRVGAVYLSELVRYSIRKLRDVLLN